MIRDRSQPKSNGRPWWAANVLARFGVDTNDVVILYDLTWQMIPLGPFDVMSLAEDRYEKTVRRLEARGLIAAAREGRSCDLAPAYRMTAKGLTILESKLPF